MHHPYSRHSLKRLSRVLLRSAALTCSLIALQHLSAPLIYAQEDWLNLGVDQSQERYTIKFTDVDVKEFIQYVSRICKTNFIYDSSQIAFNISIVSEEPATSEQILSMLLQIMRLNSFTTLEDGNNILFYSSGKKEALGLAQVVSDEDTSPRTGLVTRVFNLRYATPDKIKEILVKLATDQSRVMSYAATRSLIVCDTASNVERIADLIALLDQVDSSKELELYKIKHANGPALKGFVEQMIAPFMKTGGGGGGGGGGGKSSGGGGGSSDGDSLTMIPNPNSNSLFLIGSRALIDRAINLLNTLDVPSELEVIAKTRETINRNSGATVTDPSQILDPQINPEFYIYKLQYHQGDEILSSLHDIGNSLDAVVGSAQPLDKPLVLALKTIQWLPGTNSLLFSGDESAIIKLRNLIQSLDTPVKQVFIEALIVDVSITKAGAFGVEFGTDFNWDAPRLGLGFGNFQADGQGPLQSALTTSQAAKSYGTPPLAAGGFSAGVIGSAITHHGQSFATIGAVITAFQTDQDSRIVLNPKIITEDNVSCDFFVGQSVRIKSGMVQSSGNSSVTSSNFEIQDVGTTLRLTPIISNDELITLIVEQESSTALDTSNASDSSALVPLTKTSRTKTRLHVPDRNFVILSGMIDDNIQGTEARVPILSSIPIIGALFRSSSDTKSRRNLLFFIRPQIVRTTAEARLLTERFKDMTHKQKWVSRDIEELCEFRQAEIVAPAK